MLQESAAIPSSLWASMASWFTPAILFILLNLMIATILFISSLPHQHTTTHHDPNDHVKIARSPSVLHRLKSINFYYHRSHPAPAPPDNLNLHTQSHGVGNYSVQEVEDDSRKRQQQEDSYVHLEPRETDAARFDFDPVEEGNKNGEDDQEFQSMDEIYSQLKGVQFGRTKSDTEPGTVTNRAQNNPGRMRKSASLKPASLARHDETAAAMEARRPATVRERVHAKVTDGDEEVDAKADDFINKFKQQLKLQRLDSILGYKDKIRRGFGGR